MAPSLVMLCRLFLKFILSEIQLYKNVFLWEKISAVSQKEDVMIKEKKKTHTTKQTVISPGSSWSILQSLSQEINRFRWSLLLLTP